MRRKAQIGFTENGESLLGGGGSGDDTLPLTQTTASSSSGSGSSSDSSSSRQRTFDGSTLRVRRLGRHYIGLAVGYGGLVLLVGVAVRALSSCHPPELAPHSCLWASRHVLLWVLAAMLVAGTMVRGPMHSLRWALFGCQRPWPQTGGSVRPGFEAVEAALHRHLAEGIEGAVQVPAKLRCSRCLQPLPLPPPAF